ncbi:MAG: hypothetical protein WBB29_07625 [Geitlerinemataceae cyanobacterium]
MTLAETCPPTQTSFLSNTWVSVREYWVVDVEKSQILAFQILERGSQRITTSNVLPGLEIATLESALELRKTQDDSQIMANLMTEFSA